MELSGIKVLICDDSVLARKKFKDFLLKNGADEVIEAADGQEAVDVYKEGRPDIVFMDIVMPKKDGVEAVTEIRQFDQEAKIIMASSVGTQSYLKNAIKAGACDFLQKPLEEQGTMEAIRKALGGEE